MVRVWDVSGGELVVRRPDGTVVLDTASPLPAKIGEDSFSGVAVNFSNPSGTTLIGSGSSQRFSVPARNEVVEQTLGAYGGAGTPDVIWARAQFRWDDVGDVSGLFAFDTVTPFFTGPGTSFPDGYSNWIAWPGGSLLIAGFTGDNEPIRIWRHISLKKSGSNWVLEKRQSCSAFQSNPSSYAGTGFFAQFTMNIVIAYGVLKDGV